jgi:undecaprenyl-diphosphatase
MRVVVNDYFIPVGLSLILLALWFAGRGRMQREYNQRAVLCAAGSIGISSAIVAICNLFYDSSRPFEEIEGVRQIAERIFYCPTDPSFPSNIAAVTFAIATAIWLGGNHRLGGFLCLPAILICFARIYAGVHYPLDILGGIAIGILSAYLTYKLLLPLLDPLIKLLLRVARKLCLA